jgi:uncharacterized protein YndB with AHSA1/START domain
VIPSHIEREIVIDAPVDAAWRAVTEPDQIGRCFTDTAESTCVRGRPWGTCVTTQ